MQLLLIRHGENEYTRTGKLAGWTPEVHLNEAGRKQAQAIAERLAKAPLTAIYSSPLERARETAQPLADAKQLPVQICDDVGEVRYGLWTGRSLKVLARTKLWKTVLHRPSAMRFPEGETLRHTQARAVNALEEILTTHARPKQVVAVFSHGDVIKLLIAHYLGLPLDLFQRLAVNTASITVFRFGAGAPTLVKLNDTSHCEV